MSGDPSTLANGAVQAWQHEVDEAMGRLFVAGMAHPPVDLAPTFEMLGERAQTLGAPTARAACLSLAERLAQLAPGPPDRARRSELANALFAEVMELLAWLRLFRGRIGLAEAGAQASIDFEERDDLPRYTGRFRIQGAHLEGDRLVLAGLDDAAAPLFAVDILADLDRDDPFGRPVISRLLQRPIQLGELMQGMLDFEAHPVGHARHGRMLKPAFRSVPTLRPVRDGALPETSTLQLRWTDALEVSDPRLFVPPTLRFNLVKLLAAQGSPASLQVSLLRGRQDHRLLAAHTDEGSWFASVDSRCWSVSPAELNRWVASAESWTRAAASLYTSAPVALGTDFRHQWLRTTHGERPKKGPEPIGEGLDAFDWVWRRVLREQPLPKTLLEERFSALHLGSSPHPAEVCARALLLHHHDIEAGRAYLKAHLETVDVDAETIIWIVFAETRTRVMEVDFGLELPVHPQRMRWARLLRAFRAGEAAEGLGDILAWGALAPWTDSVVG